MESMALTIFIIVTYYFKTTFTINNKSISYKSSESRKINGSGKEQ